jgi:hypothetical protein
MKDDSIFQVSGDWYFRDLIGRPTGPFPNEEICQNTQADFDLYLLTGTIGGKPPVTWEPERF